MKSVQRWSKTFLLCASKMEWLPPLIGRLAVGYVFLESGWGKLHNLSKVIDFFTELGIPRPELQAPLVSSIEFICGGLLVVGLFTRLAAIPLIGTMAVAILTAKFEEIQTFSDVLGFAEFMYIVVLFWLVIQGPGRLSVDARLRKIWIR